MTQDGDEFQSKSEEKWLMSYLEDELRYQLSSTCPFEIRTDGRSGISFIYFYRKYHEQAQDILYRINIWNPKIPPIFLINKSDLTRKLQEELEQLRQADPKRFDMVVTEAVQSILEGVNQRYYHIANLPYKVKWKIEL